MKRAVIAGSGMAVPDKILDNNFFVEKGPFRIYEGESASGFPVWKKDEWEQEIWLPVTEDEIFKLTGIKERRIMNQDEDVVDLAYRASRNAILNSHILASDLEGIICASVTMPRDFPSMACHLQERLQAKNVDYAVDIAAGCAGSTHALDLANKLICLDGFKNVLVVGAEGLTPRVDFTDRNCILFGDGAGALILRSSLEGGIIATSFLSNASNNGEVRWLFADKKGFTRMPQGRKVMKLGINNMIKALEKVKEKASYLMRITVEEIDEKIKYYFPHQANIRIINGIAKKMEADNVYKNIEKYGNVSSATWVIALHEALKNKEVTKGDYIAIASFGSGLVAGAAIIQL